MGGITTLVATLGLLLVGTLAEARMLHRDQFKPRTGYNTGTGRMEAYDRLLAVEVDSLPLYQMSRVGGDNNKVAEKYVLAVDYNFEFLALTPEVAYSHFGEGREESGDYSELNIVEVKAQLSRYSRPHRLHGWYGRIGYVYRNIYGAHQPFIPNTSLEHNVADPIMFAGVSHGGTAAAGRRWTFINNRASVTAGLAYTRHVNEEGDLVGETEEAQSYYQARKMADYTGKRDHYPEFHLRLGLLF